MLLSFSFSFSLWSMHNNYDDEFLGLVFINGDVRGRGDLLLFYLKIVTSFTSCIKPKITVALTSGFLLAISLGINNNIKNYIASPFPLSHLIYTPMSSHIINFATSILLLY